MMRVIIPRLVGSSSETNRKNADGGGSVIPGAVGAASIAFEVVQNATTDWGRNWPISIAQRRADGSETRILRLPVGLFLEEAKDTVRAECP
jgi:hypothetical protein